MGHAPVRRAAARGRGLQARKDIAKPLVGETIAPTHLEHEAKWEIPVNNFFLFLCAVCLACAAARAEVFLRWAALAFTAAAASRQTPSTSSGKCSGGKRGKTRFIPSVVEGKPRVELRSFCLPSRRNWNKTALELIRELGVRQVSWPHWVSFCESAQRHLQPTKPKA